ncbi:PAS domain-containing hybrid sensor histidine kinase/response regulator [Desulfovibrio psychrotolerans]|uniref:histidine kinase n=1 Tax=Desulfovibrio psychrotolerans TaxID=415242 RepID=A0A7J0BWY2_9BACT|nr:PAS domain-containing hybrid sensor histidine kinase/response regulator [Desulfovibrio psychrotolerans]GFM38226.1 hypothetical protein DSM19430T_29100 [Desulfovibrio psychrotolerans]
MSSKDVQATSQNSLSQQTKGIDKKNETSSWNKPPLNIIGEATQGESSRIVYELRVHQIELEMQNEELRRMHQELEEEHERYLDLYDFAPVGYCSLSERERIVGANLTAATMLGMPRTELVGQPISRFISNGEDRHIFSATLKQLFMTGTAQNCELGLQKADILSFWANIEAVIKKNTEGSVCNIAISDISARKKAEMALAESELHFRNLANSGQALIWTSGTDMLCDYFNDSWLTFTGRELNQELGNGWSQGVHPEDMERCLSTYSTAFERREPFSMEYRLRHACGEYRWLVDQGTPRFNSRSAFVGYIGHCLDITSRKHMEEELLSTKNAAESANKSKSAFLANMSHEIRTPLNGLLGMMQLLEMTPMNDEQKMFIEMAIRSGDRLTCLLSDILDLSRIEADRMPLSEEVFTLSETLSAITDSFGPLSIQKGLPLHIDIVPGTPERVMGDEVRVRQVLFNLVGNAMKFCDQGEIRLEVFPLPPLPPDTVRILFCVSDTGPGMNDATLKTLGTPFFQATGGVTRKHQGAGLGLSICRRLVSAMGGTLTFESHLGSGTTAYLMLPFKVQEHSSLLPYQPQPALIAPSLRILLVEDDATCLIAEAEILKRMGHTVHTAKNGKEALHMLQGRIFDCVLMDIQMEVMDGLETTRNIRGGTSKSIDPKIPIVAITAYAMSGDRDRFLMEGMNDYIAKPFDSKELKAVLGRLETIQQAH